MSPGGESKVGKLSGGREGEKGGLHRGNKRKEKNGPEREEKSSLTNYPEGETYKSGRYREKGSRRHDSIRNEKL